MRWISGWESRSTEWPGGEDQIGEMRDPGRPW